MYQIVHKKCFNILFECLLVHLQHINTNEKYFINLSLNNRLYNTNAVAFFNL